MKHLPRPDDPGIPDLIAVCPIEEWPESGIIVNIRLGGDLGKGLTPFDGVAGWERSFPENAPLLLPAPGFSLGRFGFRLRAGGRFGLLPGQAPFQLCPLGLQPLSFLTDRFSLLPRLYLTPPRLGHDGLLQELPLGQRKEEIVVGISHLIRSQQQISLMQCEFQVLKFHGEELLPTRCTYLPGNDQGVCPPPGKLLGTAGRQEQAACCEEQYCLREVHNSHLFDRYFESQFAQLLVVHR